MELGLRSFLIITSSVLVSLVEPLAVALRQHGATVEIFSNVDSEPTVTLSEEVLEVARTRPLDGVIGIGGGSALDTAKLVAALYDSGQDVREVFAINLLKGCRTYLACLPTTSGTGSEVSPNAIFLDERDQLKKAWLVLSWFQTLPMLTRF